MKLKICGIRRLEDIDIINTYTPDYIGFIFTESKRKITIKQAKELKNHLNKDIPIVGVFMNDPIEYIYEVIDNDIIDMIQLHGHEDESYIRSIKAYSSIPIIKAFKIGKDDIVLLDVDYYLFDGIDPGSGQVFDWSILDQYDKPYFLAGGISLDNYKDALKTQAYALDVSSGVETDGFKDRDKIKELIEGVRNG